MLGIKYILRVYFDFQRGDGDEGILEEFAKEGDMDPCYGKPCTANEHCCPGSVCVDVDGGIYHTQFYFFHSTSFLITFYLFFNVVTIPTQLKPSFITISRTFCSYFILLHICELYPQFLYNTFTVNCDVNFGL